LPFANLSSDPGQQYFSDGITEELTGALGQNTGLTVIAWETASRYADSKKTPAEIGKALNVAHILGGSIQRDGDEVRISAELISTVTGRQLWSDHYDDSFKDIFALQDRITGAIADTLKVKFAGMQAAPTTNPQAHDLYLQGLAAVDRQTAADAQRAQQYFQQALGFDPNYADAWAALGTAYAQLAEYSTLPVKVAAGKIREAAAKALTLEPQNANALVALGIADYFDNRTAQARADFQHALALDPNNVRAHLDYGITLPFREGLAQTQAAARLDPDNVTAQNNLAEYYSDLADWPRVVMAARTMIRLSPHNIAAAFGLADAYTKMGRRQDAVEAFNLVRPVTDLDRRLVATGKLTYQAVLQPALRPKALAALDRLRRANASPNTQALLSSLYLTLGDKETVLAMLPGVCAAERSLCSDLGISPDLEPLHGDPRFEKLAKQYTTITIGSAPASASTSAR
ncbi:MAG: tetratricopeptide repeat protein, partial [Rhodanobacteraceae bacterium]